MKNFILAATMLLLFTSCGNKNDSNKAVKFPPPVVKADEEVDEDSPPVLNELEVADPGVKSVKGDPNAEIKIDEPVGNADINRVAEESPTNNKRYTDIGRKIVKNGDISFETNDIAATRQKILATLKSLGGYVDDDKESTDNEENRKDYTLNVSIPANNFDKLLNFVSSSADKIDSKNISITDVTTNYIDITTRLANKKILENRYLDLLKKASKISDLLEIENKLTEIRSDIESTQGRLNYLNKQILYSSLNITFYTKQIVKADKPIGFAYKLKMALHKGELFLEHLFFKVVALWPLWSLCIIGFITFRMWRRKRRLANAILQS
ncbi:MAG: DUF4349 domain-containing protein [Bacteroidetes bacterium]|jgi:hypothetical protein|nr:DUF4349 domain-containing protein [Bacteroidota bacterium]